MVVSDPNAGIVEAAAVAKLRSVTELDGIAISQRNRQGDQSQFQNPRTDHATNSQGLLTVFRFIIETFEDIFQTL